MKNRISQSAWKSTIAIVMAVAAPASLLADLIPLTSPGDVPAPIIRSFDDVGTGLLTDPELFYDGGAMSGFLLPGAPEGGLALIPGGVGDDVLIDVSPFPSRASIEIVFNVPMIAVGIEYIRFEGTPDLEFEAYDINGNMTSVGSVGLSGFFGLQSSSGAAEIYSVVIHDSSFGFTLNNLIYGPSHVPAPGAAFLGLIGLTVIGRLKRRFL